MKKYSCYTVKDSRETVPLRVLSDIAGRETVSLRVLSDIAGWCPSIYSMPDQDLTQAVGQRGQPHMCLHHCLACLY